MTDKIIAYLIEGGIRIFNHDRLKLVRLEHNRSQDDIAVAMGVSRQTIAKWESGDSYPSGVNARALFLLLGADGTKVFPLVQEVADEVVDSEEIKAEVLQN